MAVNATERQKHPNDESANSDDMRDCLLFLADLRAAGRLLLPLL